MKDWERFLNHLDPQKLGSTNTNWTTQYDIDRFDAQNLYLKFSDIFALNFFNEHIKPHLGDFKNANNHTIKVHTELSGRKNNKTPYPEKSSYVFEFPVDTTLNFDQFVIDGDNLFAVSLIKNLQENIQNFNPFFIYGSRSSGKSHLLMAAFNFYKSLGLKCLYVDADKFSEHVVNAMRHSIMPEFRKIYRDVDMLFFDNVQQLGGKNATQEEFFHTFNSLQMSSKAVVIASDNPASLLKNIEPRLISRFEWGLSIELPSLKKECFPKLIDSLKKRLGLNISSDHEKTLLNDFSENASTLSIALHAMQLRSHLDKNESANHLQETLEDLKSQKIELTPDIITTACAKFFNIKTKELKGPSQIRPLAFPRQITMYLIRKHLNMPYKKMGDFFERDHSTIMASITLIEERLKKFDDETLNALKRIEWDLKQL
jgi:chromosomal replication initiator protein